jgi:hypothetical protein
LTLRQGIAALVVRQLIRMESEKWGAVIRKANIHAD